jgi:hypothetical protein
MLLTGLLVTLLNVIFFLAFLCSDDEDFEGFGDEFGDEDEDGSDDEIDGGEADDKLTKVNPDGSAANPECKQQ